MIVPMILLIKLKILIKMLSKIVCYCICICFLCSSWIYSQKPVTLDIHAVGDIVLGTNFRRKALPAQEGRLLFSHVRKYLQGADILFGNFESTLTNYPKTRKDTTRSKVFAFRTPPKYVKSLKYAGFDVLSVANNHSYDFFQKGFLDTMFYIEGSGIVATGKKNSISYLKRKGVKVAFIAFGYTSNLNSIHNLPQAIALVHKAKHKADIIIASIHAGAEGNKAVHVKNKEEYFYGENRGNLVKISHHLINHGVDLILGHGPHVPRGMELYRHRLIVYSLGNFVGYHVFSLSKYKGLSYILKTKLKADGTFLKGKIVPLYLDKDGIPHYDKSQKTIGLIKRLSKSDFVKSKLSINANGFIH